MMSSKALSATAFVSLLLVISLKAQNAREANYDEAKVPEYTLPELLKSESGKTIESKEDWEKLRRPEVLQLFKDHVYGAAPGRPDSMRFKVTKTLPNALEGKARRSQRGAQRGEWPVYTSDLQ